MREQGRVTIDLAKPTANLRRWLRNTGRNIIDPRETQAERLPAEQHGLAHFRMNVIGNILGRAASGYAGKISQNNVLAVARNRIFAVTQCYEIRLGLVIQLDCEKRRVINKASARVVIGAINKRRNRIFSVSNHVRMLARQGGYDHPIDDQSAVIQAR
jgi:hypothetical protein